MSDEQVHVQIFSQLATLAKRIAHLEHTKLTINLNFFFGGHMALDFTALNADLVDATSIGDVLDAVFPAIAAAITDAKGDQTQLNALAAKLNDINVREKARVAALQGLVTPAPAALAATYNGPTVASVGVALTGGPVIAAAGGTAPYAGFTQNRGALPDGVTFAAADGSLSGTPGTAGTFNFGGSVSDAAGASAQWDGSITVS